MYGASNWNQARNVPARLKFANRPGRRSARTTHARLLAPRIALAVSVGGLTLFPVSAAFGDGPSPSCPWDLNGDKVVGPFDLATLLGSWGHCPGCPMDFNGNDDVGPFDLATLLGNWGLCPDGCRLAEDCDDGDACTANACVEGECVFEPMTPCCGNEVVEPGEQCDPPDDVTCDQDCQFISVCGPGAGDCCSPNATPGCNDEACCVCICACDPFCCSAQWDAVCSGAGIDGCGASNPDGPCATACSECISDCCVENGTPGCNDPTCETEVCSIDPFCCDVDWDSLCVSLALQLCAICRGGS